MIIRNENLKRRENLVGARRTMALIFVTRIVLMTDGISNKDYNDRLSLLYVINDRLLNSLGRLAL